MLVASSMLLLDASPGPALPVDNCLACQATGSNSFCLPVCRQSRPCCSCWTSVALRRTSMPRSCWPACPGQFKQAKLAEQQTEICHFCLR